MMNSKYKTIKSHAQAELVVCRSRFLGFAAQVDSAAAAHNFIKKHTAEFPDATHCCWAYKTGFPDNPQEHSSDAGEPSGTAGRPILGAISHYNLQNVVIVVVRYFGGIKLGIRGLIEAYAAAARSAIENAVIIEKLPMISFNIRISYPLFDIIKHEVKKNGGTIDNPTFEKDISCKISIPKNIAEPFRDELRAKGVILTKQ